MITADELEKTLTVIAAKAKSLREAGIFGRLTIGDVAFDLSDVAEPGPAAATAPEPSSTDPFNDPDTYASGHVPTRRVVGRPLGPSDDEE